MSLNVTVPDNASGFGGVKVTLRCPHCGHEGTFDPAASTNDVSVAAVLDGVAFALGQKWAGIKRCPNRTCKGLVFAVFPAGGGLADVSFPVSRIDFDTSDIPAAVTACIEEMLECHANKCYVAAAIMVRRTLELLCADKAATGKDLKTRINDLGTKIILPQELLSAMDELRLLGNDAAHVEAKEFSEIDKPHLDVAIEFTKEILKSAYQYTGLLGRLKALKNP